MYITRHIEAVVIQRSREKGAVVVTGPRQVGKTTLIEHCKPNIEKLSFDDLVIRNSAKQDPAAFLQWNQPPIFIDEVQYAPEIFPYIKINLDKTKRKGEFYLTGSQSFELMANVTESLAGRAGILELMGLSLREIRNERFTIPFLPDQEYLQKRKRSKISISVSQLWQYLHRGSMPELAINQNIDWNNFYSDYVKTYIERDVRALTQVADETVFMQFMTVCAAMTGQILNLASLARDIGISEPTAKRWLSILKTSGVIYLLQPFSTNEIKKVVKTPKLYFLDTGLAAYLSRWLTSETLATGAMNGHFFETFAISEILKSYTNAGLPANLYYLRDGNKQEIDLLIFQNNTIYPIEIKQKTNPTLADIQNFAILNDIKKIKVADGAVLCLAERILPLNSKNRIVPIWAI